MESVLNIFTKHPKSVNETYWQHCCFALGFSVKLFLAAFCALVHAFFPFLFEKTASNIMFGLVKKFKDTNRRSDEVGPR